MVRGDQERNEIALVRIRRPFQEPRQGRSEFMAEAAIVSVCLSARWIRRLCINLSRVGHVNFPITQRFLEFRMRLANVMPLSRDAQGGRNSLVARKLLA